jgi:hypothetical protein
MNRTITFSSINHAVPDNFEVGRIFEDFIVTLFNERNFRLLEWRSDKRASNGVFPLSSSYPDLEFRSLGKKNYRFAVECKWRNKFYDGMVDWATQNQINSYKDFQYQNNISVFVAIGVGGLPSNPEKLFVTPLNHICKYTDVYESHLMPYKRNPELKIEDAKQLKLF